MLRVVNCVADCVWFAVPETPNRGAYLAPTPMLHRTPSSFPPCDKIFATKRPILLSFFTPADLKDPKYSYLFLPTPPPVTTGLGRRLDPEKYYFACRWNYNDTPREFLKRCACTRGEPCKWTRRRCAAG